MKRTISCLVALVALASFCGCGEQKNVENATNAIRVWNGGCVANPDSTDGAIRTVSFRGGIDEWYADDEEDDDRDSKSDMESRVEKIVDYLEEEGYVAKHLGNGVVSVKYEGVKLGVVVDEDDETFYKVLILHETNDEVSKRVKERAMLATSAKTKAAKMYLMDEDSEATTIESFYASVDHFLPVLQRQFSACVAARLQYELAIGRDD